MITRRAVVMAFGAAAFAPLASFAQQQRKVWRVGFLSYAHRDLVESDHVYGPFVEGMRELGYVEGRNLQIVWRSAQGKIERLPGLAAELVRLKLDLLATQGTPASQAAQKATATIPIVMISIGDPLESGLANTLARPGGNRTALSLMASELGAKLLEMLREVVPKLARVAVLINPSNDFGSALLKNLQPAALRTGVRLQPLEVSTPEEITNGFAAMARENVGALIVPQDPVLSLNRKQILALAAKQRLPSISTSGGFVESGGLMSYGQNARENPRRAATYVDKIFKGANPGELPVLQPTTFEFFINRKTAAALGIKLPQLLLAQATRVIE